MIGHNIQHHAHLQRVQFLLQRMEICFRSKFGIQAGRIDYVVPVHAAVASRQDRRSINVSSAEVAEVIKQIHSVSKGEALIELQSICGGDAISAGRSRHSHPPDGC